MMPLPQQVAIRRALHGDWLLADKLEIEALITSGSQPIDRDDPYPDVDHDDTGDDIERRWTPIRVLRQWGPACRTVIQWAEGAVTCACVFGERHAWKRACKHCGGSGLKPSLPWRWCVTDIDCFSLPDDQLPVEWRS